MKRAIPDSIPRAALVTGGPFSGAIADALAGAGFAVAVQRHPDTGPTSRGKTLLLPADLSDEAHTAVLIDRATAALGPIGVLVNAAGALAPDPWDTLTRANWDMHMAINARAPSVLIQRFARLLPSGLEGVAINFLDQRVNRGSISYGASKAALWALTQSLALALAPGIRVNGIAPMEGDAPGDTPWNMAEEDVARAVIAILAFPSMTGQMIVPGGVPRRAA